MHIIEERIEVNQKIGEMSIKPIEFTTSVPIRSSRNYISNFRVVGYEGDVSFDEGSGSIILNGVDVKLITVDTHYPVNNLNLECEITGMLYPGISTTVINVQGDTVNFNNYGMYAKVIQHPDGINQFITAGIRVTFQRTGLLTWVIRVANNTPLWIEQIRLYDNINTSNSNTQFIPTFPALPDITPPDIPPRIPEKTQNNIYYYHRRSVR